jgi:hypothetical protein
MKSVKIDKEMKNKDKKGHLQEKGEHVLVALHRKEARAAGDKRQKTKLNLKSNAKEGERKRKGKISRETVKRSDDLL